MGEGDSRSDISREEAHGHVEHEPFFSKVLRMLLWPLGLFQPEDDAEYVVLEKKRDPLEETPEEALHELDSEKLGGTPADVP